MKEVRAEWERRSWLLLKSPLAVLAGVLCWGCGGSGGGSGDTRDGGGASDAPVIASVQVGTPVSSTTGSGQGDGTVTTGDAAVVSIDPTTAAPYSRMQLWLQVNTSGPDIDHYDWEIRDWASSPPNGTFTNYDSVIDIDGSNGVYLVRTSGNRIRYDTPPIVQLQGLEEGFTQTVVVTAWTSGGRFTSAYFTIHLTEPAWVKFDVNRNGLSDVWEAAYSAEGMDPAGDADLDGRSNWEESIAGTDPNDCQSVFRIQAVALPGAAYLMRWNSIAGKVYQVEATTSLAGGEWLAVGAPVQGGGSEVVASVPQTTPAFVAMRHRLLTDNHAFVQGRTFLPDGDTDGDGFGDVDEWAAGTDPYDPASRFDDGSIDMGRAVMLEWPSVRGKYYQVHTSPSAVRGTWTSRGGLLPGNGSKLTTTVEVSGLRQFFRVSVIDSDSDSDGLTDWEEKLTGLEIGPWHYRTNFPTDPAQVTAIVTSTNIISVEPGRPVANVTRGSPGSFVITRSGNLNALSISYTVGGDTIPNVHYEALPGVITLAPGVNRVEIPVVPLSEAGLDPVKRVVITLNASADFVLGSNDTAQVNVLREAALSVRDFGAIGDGATDETPAIQAAIDALEASSGYNTLHFPTGRYRLNTPRLAYSPLTHWNQLLVLGRSDLSGRDLIVAGDAGAELYSTVSSVRTRMLVAHATFRSLSFHGLTWRKEDHPLPETTGPPNGAEGVALFGYDLRRVEAVDFLDCSFVNCHGAVMAFHNGYDTRGRLARLGFQRCNILNPYGSNTKNGQAAFGGGVQVGVNQWVRNAVYSENLFDGGTNGPVDPIRNPGGERKDGSHFGSPLHLIFTNNIVRHMGVEAVYQTDDPVMGVLEAPFEVPPADGTSTVDAKLKLTFLSTYRAGQILNFRTPGTPWSDPNSVLLTVVSHSPSNRLLTVRNDGLTAGAVGTTVPAPIEIYLQSEQDASVAHIVGNIFEDEAGSPVGLLAIGANAKATITHNFIRNYLIGIQLYDSVHDILFSPTLGTRVESNVILTDDSRASVLATYGVQSWGPGDIIHDNLVVTPVSTHFVGVAMRGRDSWAEANMILPVEIARHPYGDVNRSVGIGVGNVSRGTTSVANRTSGLDVGNGPVGAYQSAPRRVINHFSTNDTLAIDPRGLTVDSLP